MGSSNLGFSSVVIYYKAWLVTYIQVGVLCCLNQMLIPGRERMCRLGSKRCCRYGIRFRDRGGWVGGVASTTLPVHWGNHCWSGLQRSVSPLYPYLVRYSSKSGLPGEKCLDHCTLCASGWYRCWSWGTDLSGSWWSVNQSRSLEPSAAMVTPVDWWRGTGYCSPNLPVSLNWTHAEL